MSGVGRWASELGYSRIGNALMWSGAECPPDHPFAPEIQSMFAGSDAVPAVSAVFCLDRVPTVCLVDRTALPRQETQRRSSVRALCERLWNQNLARVVLVVDEATLEAWSVDNPGAPAEKTAISDYAKSSWSVDGLLGGEALNKREKWFNPKNRVDSILLDNILQILDHFKKFGIMASFARELIAKVIFVAYLEDRGIVGDEYRATNQVGRLHDLLGRCDAAGLEKLFRQLKEDFNGDFLKPAPEGRGWGSIPKEAFGLLYNFLSHTVLRTGQQSFWRYDFREIPIELIAGIYETFLASKDLDTHEGAEGALKRKLGAYYTPRLLADWVVDVALEGKDILRERIFDGACGSGMLLTAAFRKLVRAHQAREGHDTSATFTARKDLLLNQIFGADVDEDACRLTKFSLYLALLSDLSPRDLSQLGKGGDKLPNLGNNITSGPVDGDFFSPVSTARNHRRFTTFISNPPWRQLSASEPSAAAVETWRQGLHPHPPTIPNRQIATAFAIGAPDTVIEGGRVALILPVNAFVSAERSARAFRADLLARMQIEKIINFSDMRRIVFADAVHPFLVLVGTSRPESCRRLTITDEAFEYWTPKSDISLAFGRIAIHGSDRTVLPADSLIDEMPHLRLRYWGNGQDMAILHRLWRHGSIRSLLNSHGWLAGKGFHLKDEDRRRPSSTWYVEAPAWMKEGGFVHANDLPADTPVLHRAATRRFPFERIARVPEERLFQGPRIIWPDGTHPEAGVKAIFVDKPMSYQHSVGVLAAPNNDLHRLIARFVTAYLRSPMGVWLSLLLSSSVASERPKLHVDELLDWPFIHPDEHPQAPKAHALLERVDDLTKLVEEAPELLQAETYARVKPELDAIVMEYFGLPECDRTAIRELASYAGSSLQPTSLKYEALARPMRQRASDEVLRGYCERVRDVLHSIRDISTGKAAVTVSAWTARTVPVGAAVISMAPSSGQGDTHDRLNDDAIINEISIALAGWGGTNEKQITIPHVVLFDGERILIIKPLIARLWLQRAAIEDATALALEIQAVGQARSE